MGILREVSEICKTAAMAKKSQAPGFYHIPQGPAGDSLNASNAHILRGAAKGIKEAIPGLLDSTVGNAYGLGRGIARTFTGEGFGTGFDEGKNEWNDYVTNPMRKIEMSLGGNAVKKTLDGTVKYHENLSGGHNPWNDYLEGAAETGTDMALTWPLYGKAIGAAFKGTGAASKALSKIPVVGRTAKAAPWAALAYHEAGGQNTVDELKSLYKDKVQGIPVRDQIPELKRVYDESQSLSSQYAQKFVNGKRGQKLFDAMYSNPMIWDNMSPQDQNAVMEAAKARGFIQ